MASPSKNSKLYTPGQEALFPMSRSKVELFQQCRRCFYLDRRLGISRPPGFPFSLNSAVDALLKKKRLVGTRLSHTAGSPRPSMRERMPGRGRPADKFDGDCTPLLNHKDSPGFDARLEFRISMLPHVGNTDWIERTVLEIKQGLDQETVPEPEPECPFCTYIEAIKRISKK